MTQKQILKAAIEKAVNNGYDLSERDMEYFFSQRSSAALYYEALLFDHDFARAFWGNKKHRHSSRCPKECFLNPKPQLPAWEYHIQQLAVTEDRLAYIEKFLR